jgi:opacity protein-like surface antigen
MTTTVRGGLLVALVLVALGPAPARAEFLLDGYGGLAWTRQTDVEIRGLDVLGVPVRARLLDVEPDTSFVVGARFGYWFGALPEVGVGVDAFYFEPDVRSQRVTATAAVRGEILDEDIDVTVGGPARIPSAKVPAGVIALDLMARWRAYRSEAFPDGRVQPYVTAGPAFLITDPEDFGTAPGLKVGAGVAVHVLRALAVFGEYRFTYFRPEVDSGGLTYKADLSTHHLVFGLSLRF